jgi:hypothetical protein
MVFSERKRLLRLRELACLLPASPVGLTPIAAQPPRPAAVDTAALAAPLLTPTRMWRVPTNSSPRASSTRRSPGSAISPLNSPLHLVSRLEKISYRKRDDERVVARLEALKEKPNDGEATELPGYLQNRPYDRARASFVKMCFSVPAESAQAHVVPGTNGDPRGIRRQGGTRAAKGCAHGPAPPMAHFPLGETYVFQVPGRPRAGKNSTKSRSSMLLLRRAHWPRGDAYARVKKWEPAERALKQPSG